MSLVVRYAGHKATYAHRELVMKLIDFYVDLRAEILEVMSGIKNADPSLFFDSTKSNSQIKTELNNIFIKYSDSAREFGVEVFYRYYRCSNKRHRDTVSLSCDGVRFLGDDVYKSYEQFFVLWDETMLLKCPCSRNNQVEINSRQVLLGFKAGEYSAEKDAVNRSLAYVAYAKDCAADKKPRSGIRENLLIAILVLNDAIAPEKMSDTINRIRSERGV